MALSRLTIDLAVDLAGFESDMGRAARVTERQLKSVEREIERFSVRAGALLGAALVTGLVQAGKAANEFGRSMAEVSTLLDDTSSLDSMTESVKTLAKEFGRAPTEQASALYQIISSGAEAGAEAIDVLTAANKLAVGGVTDLKTAADGLTSVMNAYGSEAGSVAEISDKFFAAMKAGKTTVGELSGAIGPVINIAKELGVSFDELIAAASTLTLSGNTTSQSFNALKAALANVVKPSKDAQQVAEQLGIDFNAAALESKGLAVFLAEVQKAAGGNTEAISKLFGSVEGLNAVLALTGSSADTFAEVLKSVQNAAGETDEAVSKMQETADQAFKRLSAAVKVELIEIGAVVLDKLVPAIELVTDNIEELGEALKVVGIAVAAFTGVRLAAMTLGFAALAKQMGIARVAVLAFGGPLNVAAIAITAVVVAYQKLRDASLETDRVTNQLAGSVQALTAEWIAHAEAADLVARQTQIRQQWLEVDKQLIKVQEDLARLRAQAPDDLEQYHAGIKSLVAEEERLLAAQHEAVVALAQINSELKSNKAFEEAEKRIAAVRAETARWGDELDRLAGSAGGTNQQLNQQARALGPLVSLHGKFADRLEDLNALWEESEELLRDATREQDRYERSLQSILDALNPIQAEGRRVGEMLADLTRAFREGTISQAEYQRYVQQLTQDFNAFAAGAGVAAGGVDLLSVAIDEGARIIERTFQDLFRDIISGSDDAWESIESGFQSMLASINSAATRGITVRIQEAFAEGGGGFSDLKLSGAFGQELVSSIGSILGLTSADTLFGQLGSTLGNIFGKSLFSTLLPNIFSALGTWAGPIGTAIGSILGSVVGDLIGELFGRDLRFTLGGENARTRGDNQQIRTPLGDILGLSGQGNFGSLLDPSSFGGQIARVLTEFDTEIANIFKAVGLDDETFSAVTNSLDNWVATFGEGAEAVDVLSSRFGVILGNFSADIQNFVRGAEDFEEQIERFGVALTADKLFKDNPNLFADKTVGDFLSILEDFKLGSESMGDALTRLLPIINSLISISDALNSYASSDLAADFDALINPLSLEQALANVNAELGSMIDNFDGSIEQFETIGQLSMVVREGELKLLAQIDAIQKGINANLDKLKADILGLDAADKTGEQLFLDAQKLIGKITDQSSAADIAAIEQEFNSILRSISPEDQLFMQSEILALIEAFRNRANPVLDMRESEVLAEGERMRGLVSDFMTRVGDPLDLIAANTQRSADSLDEITGAESLPETATPALEVANTSGDVANQIIVANGIHSANQEEIMGEGLRQIDASVQQIGPIVAGALAQGLSQVSFTINLDGGGLVTQ